MRSLLKDNSLTLIEILSANGWNNSASPFSCFFPLQQRNNYIKIIGLSDNLSENFPRTWKNIKHCSNLAEMLREGNFFPRGKGNNPRDGSIRNVCFECFELQNLFT